MTTGYKGIQFKTFHIHLFEQTQKQADYKRKFAYLRKKMGAAGVTAAEYRAPFMTWYSVLHVPESGAQLSTVSSETVPNQQIPPKEYTFELPTSVIPGVDIAEQATKILVHDEHSESLARKEARKKKKTVAMVSTSTKGTRGVNARVIGVAIVGGIAMVVYFKYLKPVIYSDDGTATSSQTQAATAPSYQTFHSH